MRQICSPLDQQHSLKNDLNEIRFQRRSLSTLFSWAEHLVYSYCVAVLRPLFLASLYIVLKSLFSMEASNWFSLISHIFSSSNLIERCLHPNGYYYEPESGPKILVSWGDGIGQRMHSRLLPSRPGFNTRCRLVSGWQIKSQWDQTKKPLVSQGLALIYYDYESKCLIV